MNPTTGANHWAQEFMCICLGFFQNTLHNITILLSSDHFLKSDEKTDILNKIIHFLESGFLECFIILAPRKPIKIKLSMKLNCYKTQFKSSAHEDKCQRTLRGYLKILKQSYIAISKFKNISHNYKMCNQSQGTIFLGLD